jgi:hypothetical protein
MVRAPAADFPGMDSTERQSILPTFDRRFVRNVFVAVALGALLGLLVVGNTFLTALTVAVAVAVVYALVFIVWGWVRQTG